MTLGAPCQKGIHHRCPQKLGSGRVCECDCHKAERETKPSRPAYGHNKGNTVFCHFCEWSKLCPRGMEEIEAVLKAHLQEAHGKPLLYRIENESGKRTDIP